MRLKRGMLAAILTMATALISAAALAGEREASDQQKAKAVLLVQSASGGEDGSHVRLQTGGDSGMPEPGQGAGGGKDYGKALEGYEKFREGLKMR